MVVESRRRKLFRSALAIVTILALLATLALAWRIFDLQAKSWSLAGLERRSEAYLSNLKDVETALRGYIVTGEEPYLEPYVSGVANEPALAADLAASLRDIETTGLTETALLTSGKALLARAETLVSARRQSFAVAVEMVKSDVGKNLMDSARDSAAVLTVAARREFAVLNTTLSNTLYPLIIATTLALGLAAAGWFELARRSRVASERSSRALRSVIENAPIGVALIDRSHTVLRANQKFMDSAGAVGMTADGIINPISAPKLASMLSHGDLQSAEITLDDASDTERLRVYDISSFPVDLTDADGARTSGFGVTVIDVTDQKAWEAELEEAKEAAEAANRAKSTFLANMSHELRTPLTAVLGYCELIAEDLDDAGAAHVADDLRKIEINARHLLGLINDVLDLSKIEAQKMDVHAVSFTLRKLFEEVEAATSALAIKNDNAVRVEAAAEVLDAELVTDDLKLKQILLNLISNSCKFTNAGEITVSASLHDGRDLTLSVRDNGIGMTEEQVQRLFKRFSQADQTTTRKYGGTGLGLALTKALTTMLGGTIAVDSRVGRGTVFNLRIPARYERRHTPGDEPPGEATPADRAAYSDEKPLILIVDDEAPSREILRRHLAKEGFQVAAAVDGKQALERIRTLKPEAVLLDIMMPGLDGWRVLDTVKSNPETRSTPVIVQTVLDEKHFAFALGADGFLKKPITRQNLSEALDRLVVPKERQLALIVSEDGIPHDELSGLLEREGWNVSLMSAGQLQEATDEFHGCDVIIIDSDDAARQQTLAADARRKTRRLEIPVIVANQNGSGDPMNNGRGHSLDELTDRLSRIAKHRSTAQTRSGASGDGQDPIG